MKFTSEMESNDSLSFFNVLVGENGPAVFTTVYGKPNSSVRYIHYEKNHPSHIKKGGGGSGIKFHLGSQHSRVNRIVTMNWRK